MVKRRTTTTNDHKSDILVNGKGSILTHLAKCCSPIKGDDIIGVITKTDGIAIHRKDCSNAYLNPDKQVEVSWETNTNNLYISTLLINVISEKDHLSDIIAVITSDNISIDSINIFGSGIYKINIKIKDITEIEKVIKDINKLTYVKGIKRLWK